MAVPNSPPKNLDVSFYLLKHCDLWVWDFDDTLIDTTTYYVQDMSPSAIRDRSDNELDREIPCWKYFRDLIVYIVSIGKRVGIASFGTYEIIRAYMDRIFGNDQKYFTKANIKAACMEERRKREFNMPHNKNAYIYDLMHHYRVQDYEKVVLFDDLSSNIADASSIGVLGILIPGRDQNGINNSRQLFCPDVMYHIDNDANKKCGQNIYLRREFGGIGQRKAFARDKQFGKVIRYRHPNRIYRSKETRDREEREEKEIKKFNQQNKLEEGFQNSNSKDNETIEDDTIDEEEINSDSLWNSFKKIFGDEGKSDCGCTGNAWLIYLILLFVLLILIINYLL